MTLSTGGGSGEKITPPSYAEYIFEEQKIPPEELLEGQRYWRNMLKDFDEKKHLPPVDIQGVDAWTENEIILPIKNITNNFFKHKKFIDNTFMLAASMLAMAKITGAKESIMSWLHTGRVTRQEVRLMGIMLDQYPISYNFDRNLTVNEFLIDLETKINEGMKYRKSLGAIYDEGLEDDCATFIFQKSAGFGERGIMNLNNTDAVIQELPLDDNSVAENSLDIELNAEKNGTYTLVLDYDTSRYSEKSMRKFAQILDDMLLILQDEKQNLLNII